MAQSINQVRSDQAMDDVDDIESSNNSGELEKSKLEKAMKRLGYVTLIVLFLTAAVLVFVLTFMRMANPKLRIGTIEIEDLEVSDSNAEMKLEAEVSVKNTNFGYFEFEESSVKFLYDGDVVGEGSIGSEKAGARSTKRIEVTVDVEIEDSSRLDDDSELGFLSLKSRASLNGQIHLFKVIKKQKTVEMDCTVVINLVDKVVRDLKCNN